MHKMHLTKYGNSVGCALRTVGYGTPRRFKGDFLNMDISPVVGAGRFLRVRHFSRTLKFRLDLRHLLLPAGNIRSGLDIHGAALKIAVHIAHAFFHPSLDFKIEIL